MKFSYGKIFLLGFGSFGVSVIWGVYNAFVPLYLPNTFFLAPALIGFFMTLFGVGVFIYVLMTYFVVGSLPGFPFLASIIALFSGAQLFALGIFGEYLALIFDRSMDHPPYVINRSVG